LIQQQRADGYWLPNNEPSAMGYIFETTLLVLEALLQYQNQSPQGVDSALINAELIGQEYLLRNNLGLSDNIPIKRQWRSFSFPSYWYYDVLTALDYFRAFCINKDIRIQSSISLLLQKQKDGMWRLGSRHPGKTYFDMETPGKPSRWNTLRALRVLEWWDNG
jgi:hypothetical protein